MTEQGQPLLLIKPVDVAACDIAILAAITGVDFTELALSKRNAGDEIDRFDRIAVVKTGKCACSLC